MAVSDYNTDPDLNVDISGINIAEGCPPSGINNAIRQMMADIKTEDGDLVKKTGDQSISGTKTFSSAIVSSQPEGLRRNLDNGYLRIEGATSSSNGAYLDLFGTSHGSFPGYFRLSATGKYLLGKPDGTLTWDSKEFVFASGDQTIANHKTFSSTIYGGTNIFVSRNDTNAELNLYGGSTSTDGAGCYLYGGGSSYNGQFRIRAAKNGTYRDLIGTYNGNITWNGQTIQTSSDERLKTAFSAVPDAILDAWAKVNWQQFKFKDAVAEKGEENCRWHNGLVAQRVKAVFEAEGLDSCTYGILCHDEWEDEHDDDGNLVRPAGDLWTIRYEEALAMEAAYQRRRANRAEARITALERRLDEMEQFLSTVMGE